MNKASYQTLIMNYLTDKIDTHFLLGPIINKIKCKKSSLLAAKLNQTHVHVSVMDIRG